MHFGTGSGSRFWLQITVQYLSIISLTVMPCWLQGISNHCCTSELKVSVVSQFIGIGYEALMMTARDVEVAAGLTICTFHM